MAILALASVAIFVSATKIHGREKYRKLDFRNLRFFFCKNFICDKKFLLY